MKRKQDHFEGVEELHPDLQIEPTRKKQKVERKPSIRKSLPKEEDSATEDEDDLLAKDILKQKPAPAPVQSEQQGSDTEEEPNRIIGSINPLEDFERNIATGDVITQAVKDLAEVVTEVVLKPFAARRQSEMIKCMEKLRTVALTEDEISAWNE